MHRFAFSYSSHYQKMMVRLCRNMNLAVVVAVLCVSGALKLMPHYIFCDISKASFHPPHKASLVEHISQFA